MYPPTPRTLTLAAALFGLALMGGSAQAQAQAAEGARLFLEADFEQSRQIFEQLLVGDSLTAEDAVEAHRYLAALDLIHGDRDAAMRHARAAVALRATVEVPEGAPEELAQLLTEASQSAGGIASLDLELSPEGGDGGPLARLTLRRGAPELLTGLRLRCESGSYRDAATGEAPELSLRIPAETHGTLACEGAALSAGGAALLLVSESLELAAGGGTGGGDPLLLGVLAGATVVLAIAATVAVSLLVADSDGAEITGARVVGWETP